MNPADQFITRGSVFAAGWCSMTDREDARRAALLRKGDRVVVWPHSNPNGSGEIVSADRWTASVRMDSDGLTYMFGICAVAPAGLAAARAIKEKKSDA